MEIPILRDIVIIICLAVIVLLLFRKIRIHPVLAFFLTGMLAGPQGFALIGSVEEVRLLAELGVIFLLFTIGIEFSLERFSQIRRYILIGGALQLTFTLVSVYFLSLYLGLNNLEAIFAGFLASFSSTAIVLRILQDKNEIHSLHGQISLGILIFQDMAVVLVILFIPLLAGINAGTQENWLQLLAMGLGLILFIIISTKWLVPALLHYIARFKSRELFLLTIMLICLGVTWITSTIGLSTALGAFLAGLIISNTDYSHQALGNILPFKDVFLSFFFVSVGMLMNIGFIAENLVLIIVVTFMILIIKAFMAGLTVGLLGLSLRVMVLVGLILSQIGEFSFILAAAGLRLGIISESFFQIFLSVCLITLSLTPFIMNIAPSISDFSDKLPLPNRIRLGFYPLTIPPEKVLKDHLIIIGYGINGKNMAKAASKARIPYVVVEINPDIVRAEKARGTSIYFGDAANEAVLKNINIKEAKIMVLAISDPIGTRKIIDIAKKLNSHLYIIVRTRYIREMETLYKMGADEIIPEEFETSIEIFSRVLNQYNISKEKIQDYVSEIRYDGYEMFRKLSKDNFVSCKLKEEQKEIEITSILVNTILKGNTVGELIKKFEIEIIAIVRGSKTIKNTKDEFKLLEGDLLIISGERDKISQLKKSLF